MGKKIDDEDPKLVGYLTLEDLEKCGLFDLFSVKKALEKEDGIKTFIEDENDSNSASIYAFHENLLHEFLSTKDNPNILKKNKLLKNDLLDASHFVHQLAKTNFEDSLHTAEAQVIDNFFDLHENKSLMEKHGFYFNEDEDNEADFREQFADFVAENKDKINSKFKSLKEQGKKADKTNEIDDLEKLIQLMALVTDIDLGEYNTEEIIKQLEKKGVPQKDRTVAGHVEKFNNLVDLQELIDIAFNDRGRLY